MPPCLNQSNRTILQSKERKHFYGATSTKFYLFWLFREAGPTAWYKVDIAEARKVSYGNALEGISFLQSSQCQIPNLRNFNMRHSTIGMLILSTAIMVVSGCVSPCYVSNWSSWSSCGIHYNGDVCHRHRDRSLSGNCYGHITEQNQECNYCICYSCG